MNKKYKTLCEGFFSLKALAITSSVIAAIYVLGIFFIIWKSKKTSKRNIVLTNELNKILGTPNKYNIRIVNDTEFEYNAFAHITNDLYIFQGLVDICSDREIMAIMIHEATHKASLHLLLSAPTKIIGVTGIITSYLNLKYSSTSHKPSGLLRNVLIFAGLYLSSELINNYFSRLMEYAADSKTKKYGYHKDLITALTKLHDVNLKLDNKNKSKIRKMFIELQKLFSSHPDLQQRIKNLINDPNVATYFEKSATVRDFMDKIKSKQDNTLDIYRNTYENTDSVELNVKLQPSFSMGFSRQKVKIMFNVSGVQFSSQMSKMYNRHLKYDDIEKIELTSFSNPDTGQSYLFIKFIYNDNIASLPSSSTFELSIEDHNMLMGWIKTLYLHNKDVFNMISSKIENNV